MKKQFSRILLMSLIGFSFLLLLSACSNQKSNQTSSTSTPKSSQVSSSKTKSSQKEGSTASSSKTEASSSSNINASSSSTTSQQSSSSSSSSQSSSQSSSDRSKTEASNMQSSQTEMDVDMDTNALVRGDYTSIAGTWKDSDGSLLVFNTSTLLAVVSPQKQATVHNYIVSKGDYKDGSGQFDATLSNDSGDKVTTLGDIRFVSKKADVSGPAYEQDTIQVTAAGVTKVYFKASSSMEVPKDLTITDDKTPLTPNDGLASSGIYRFDKSCEVKLAPSNDAKVIFYFGAGESVRYDQKLYVDGRTWISYISYSGVRRYVKID